jgi:hypothetical protein
MFFTTVVRSFTPNLQTAQLIDDMVRTALGQLERSNSGRMLLVDAKIAVLAPGWLAVTVLARPLIE